MAKRQRLFFILIATALLIVACGENDDGGEDFSVPEQPQFVLVSEDETTSGSQTNICWPEGFGNVRCEISFPDVAGLTPLQAEPDANLTLNQPAGAVPSALVVRVFDADDNMVQETSFAADDVQQFQLDNLQAGRYRLELEAFYTDLAQADAVVNTVFALNVGPVGVAQVPDADETATTVPATPTTTPSAVVEEATDTPQAATEAATDNATEEPTQATTTTTTTTTATEATDETLEVDASTATPAATETEDETAQGANAAEDTPAPTKEATVVASTATNAPATASATPDEEPTDVPAPSTTVSDATTEADVSITPGATETAETEEAESTATAGPSTTATPRPSNTPTATFTATQTPTPSATMTASATSTPSDTPTPTFTASPSPTPTRDPSLPTETVTPFGGVPETPTDTPTATDVAATEVATDLETDDSDDNTTLEELGAPPIVLLANGDEFTPLGGQFCTDASDDSTCAPFSAEEENILVPRVASGSRLSLQVEFDERPQTFGIALRTRGSLETILRDEQSGRRLLLFNVEAPAGSYILDVEVVWQDIRTVYAFQLTVTE